MPATVAQTETDQTTVTVIEGTVGRSLAVSVTLNQPLRTIATNTLTGIVSNVYLEGEKSLGDPIYSVAGIPVRLFEGDTPFYRELSRGSKGTDVQQLQQGLINLGFLKVDKPDSNFGLSTVQAVKLWQKSMGQPQTGAVALGEVLSAPKLPTAVVLGEDIVLGSLVSGGEDAFATRSGEQEFILVISPEQAQNINSDVTLRVFYEEYTWDAVVSQTFNDAEGNVVMALTSPDGQLLCGQDCGALPSDSQITLRSEAVVVPEVSGSTVPVAAIRIGSDGTAYVNTPDNTEIRITVLGSGQGLAVVDGLAVGQEILTSSLDKSGDPSSSSSHDSDAGKS